LKNGAIFWQPAGTYCLHMVISELFPWNPATSAHFFHKSPVYESH
jgi:hypothetical protein